MDTDPQRPRQNRALSSLNAAIGILNIAGEVSGISPARIAFGPARALLTTVRDSMINDQDYVDLALYCADICEALDRGIDGKRLDELSQPLCEAINRLTTTCMEIQKNVIEQNRRSAASPLLPTKNDKMIAAWKSDLNRILRIFNIELALNTHVMVADIRHVVSRIREEIGDQVRSSQSRSAISDTGESALSSPNAATEAMNIAEERSDTPPAKAAFGSVIALMTTTRDSMTNDQDYVELALYCADICEALDRGINEKRLDELNQPLCETIDRLTTTVAEIMKKATEQSRQNTASPLPHAKDNKKMIAAWKSDLNKILRAFNVELAMNTHVVVADIRHDVSRILKGIGDQVRSSQSSTPPGELPPPPPRACFGRNELIDEIVGLATNLTPIALIGAGGVGKTSIALAVLHDDRIKERFGVNCWFIRCDQFPASLAHFLRRLSEVIGAGIENPEDLTRLRPFLFSREMILFLDNAEYILDPEGTDAQEIYTVVEELSHFGNICLGITSRIYTVPPHCKRLIIPTLSMESACDTFYHIYCTYDDGGRSDIISDLVRQLDFHPLSITLLATVASHNMWGYDQLARKWDTHRTQVLRANHGASLAAMIELSLASPTFCKLGPDARDLLGVIAFFPQGIDENLDWLFPTIADKEDILYKFRLLSLTYQNNDFVTMLAPLRDYLSPKSPEISPLLHATKERYFRKLSVNVHPAKPGFEEARWIMSEDANVEHLLDVFTSADTNSDDVWQACAYFMEHLYWYKSRIVVLGPKIEGLPDNHPSKPECLFQLSRLFSSVGNHTENGRLLIHTLRLWKERGDDLRVAETLVFLSDTNRQLGFYKEGISQAKESLEIYEQHDDTSGQARSLQVLAQLLNDDKQLDAAETAGSRAIDLLNINDQFGICQCHRVLGHTFRSKGETEKAITHFEKALAIASPSSWDNELFWIHHSLAGLFSGQDRSGDAHVHIERAKSHVVNNLYNLGLAMELQARVWHKEGRFEEAKSEALHAADVFERLGAVTALEGCRVFLRDIEGERKN